MGAVDLGLALARGTVFITALQAAGAALFLMLFGRHVPRAADGIRRLGRLAAILAVALIFARSGLEPARMAGELAGVLDPFLRSIFWQSDVSAAQLVRLGGLALVFVSLLSRRSSSAYSQAIGVSLVVLSFALMGHTRVPDGSPLPGVLVVVHVATVVFWFGALVPLLICLRSEPTDHAQKVLAAFSRLAMCLVPGLVIAGAWLAWILLESFAAFLTPYGLLLLGKLAGLAGLLGLAALNKYRLLPALTAGRTAAYRTLRRSIILETALMVAVFMLTAIMTTLFSPQ